MNKRNSLFLGLIGAVLFSVFNTNMAFAEIAESSTIYQKVFYEGVVTCFDTAAENGGLKGTITLGDFDGSANSFFDKNNNIVATIGDARYAKISCKKLLTEKTEKKLPTATTSDATVKDQRLIDAKYSKNTTSTETNDGGACYSFKYKKYTTKKNSGDFVKVNEYYTPQLCISKDANGNFVSSVKEIAGQYDYNEAGLVQRQLIKFENLGENKLRLNVNTDGVLGFYKDNRKDYDLSQYGNESQIIAMVGNDIASLMGSTVPTSNTHNEDSVTTGTTSGPGGYTTTETWKQTYYAACQDFEPNLDNSGINCTSNQDYSMLFSSQAGLDTVYKKMVMRGNAYSTVVSNFSNNRYNYNSIKFSDDEIYVLYQYYLTDIYKVANINCTNIGGTLNGAGKYNARLWWSTENKYGNCYFDVDNRNKDIRVNGVYDTGIFGKEIGLDELNAKLNSLTNSANPGSNIHANTDQTDEGVPPEKADCLSSGAAGSLGWIACPMISGMAEATDGISKLLDDWLSIDTRWYDSNNSDGARTYKAWGYFRTFANIVMIIILLAIVFSQLTGVGIDNYGIKKMLPKLIIMAILINLSYIICEVVIDLSNILGTGLNKLFASIGESITDTRVTFGQGATTVVASLLGIGSVAGMGATTVIPIAMALTGGGGMTVIFSLILVLLIAFVAVVLFFASIGARMIIVILFTAISPLAFACYILPNTQTLFKKWLNVFKAAVLVYPICGALYGLAQLVNNLIFSGSGSVSFPLALIGVCAPLIPFFALPSLLKGAMAGLGVVGGALTAMGAGLKKGLRGANSAVQGTDQFKNAQNRGRMKTGEWSAKRFRGRMDNRIDRGLNDTDRARAQELRNKIRNNTASDEEKKQYNDIIGRSRNKLTEGQTARLADAQAKINAYESQKEKETNGADDVVVAGMRQKDSYSNQNAADEARNWTESYYRDNDGNVWVSDGRGKYHTVDKNGNKREMSSGAVREALSRKKGVMVSRRDAMLNQDFANRAKQSGALAGYANESRAQAAAFGSRLSSLETSQSGLIDMAQSGQDNVLQIQHDANVDKRTQVAGRAQAAANFRAQGFDTTISKEAATQAAEKQFENVTAQNLAAENYASKIATGVYDADVVRKQAIQAGTIKAINQTTNTVETNAVGEVVIDHRVAQKNAQNAYNLADAKNNPNLVPEITADYAKSLEQQRFDTSQRKMYSEEFKNQTRGQIGQIVNSMMDGSNATHAGDANYMAAAISDFISKGGNEDFLNYVFANQAHINSDPTMKSIIDSTMSTMPEGSAKQYGKYVSAIADYNADPSHTTKLVARGFADWMKEASPSESGIIADEKASFKGYLQSISGDITGRTKDEYKFMAGNPDVYKHINSADAYYAALSSKGDSLVAANKLVKEIIGSNDDKRAEVINSIKIDDATKTSAATWAAILGDNFADASFTPTGAALTALRNFRDKLYDKAGDGSYVPKKGLERAAANLSNDIKQIIFKLPDP